AFLLVFGQQRWLQDGCAAFFMLFAFETVEETSFTVIIGPGLGTSEQGQQQAGCNPAGQRRCFAVGSKVHAGSLTSAD
ncbi:MAG: hypothetical protein Q8R49_08275, partial [Rhodoferax sp.]|nr:hypothetical protein [Rhodoferax sp.]